MKLGNFIEELRHDNSLSIHDFAAKYEITPKEVTEWEKGLKLPDMTILKKICDDFKVDINTVLSNEEAACYIAQKKTINRHIYYIVVLTIFLILSTLVLIKQTKSHETYDFKTITTACDDFSISADIAYEKTTSSIYITKLNYCGGNDKTIYDVITGSLYETEGNALINNGIKRKNIKLEEYLKNIKLSVDNYLKDCLAYDDSSLYLEVKAMAYGKTNTYNVALNLNDSCPNKS